MSLPEAFLWGLFGGVAAEILGLFRLRRELAVDLPTWLRSPIYWIVTVLMICVGGALVVMYVKAGFALNALLAVNVGASAPLIIGALVQEVPTLSVGRVD